MRIILLLITLFIIRMLFAESDSLRIDTLQHKKIKFLKSRYVTESIVPLSLAAGGLTIMAIPDLKVKLQEKLDWNTSKIKQADGTYVANPKNIDMGEDYIRYAPTVAAYTLGFCGLESKHRFVDRSIVLAMSYILSDFIVNNTKKLTKELRPLGDQNNSFPSQHTAMAFVGATFLDHELGYISPWISVAGYATASYVGYCRIARNAHWTNDVLMGAAVGILSTHATYWAYDGVMKLFPKQLTLSPVVSPEMNGLYLSYKF